MSYFSVLLRMVAFMALLAVTASVSAEQGGEMDDFHLGKQAFENKLYQQALEYFESAKGIGENSIALRYNLAVTHYKLGNFEQSQIYFNAVRDHPKMTSLIDYNLGLIELKLNNKEQAIVLFEQVHQQTSSKTLKSLSRKQLNKLRNIKTNTRSRIHSRFSLSRAFTDNVTTIATGTASGQSDNFTIISASVGAALTNSFRRGLIAKVRYFNQDLSNFNQYDFSETEFNVKYSILSGRYQNSVATFYKRSNLQSQPYQIKTGFEAIVYNKIDKTSNVSYRYRYENLTEDQNIYLYLSGSRQQLRVNYRLFSKSNYSQFRYQFESNERNDTATRSYSPQRHSLRYSYSFKFFDNWKSRSDVEYRRSNYPNVATQNRNDDRFRLLTALSYKLSKMWKVQGRYEYRDNKSTDLDYVYKRNLYYMDLSFNY